MADTAVHTVLLTREPLRLALPREHRLAGQHSIQLAQVAAEPFIGLRPASSLRTLTDELCHQAGFRPAVSFESDDLPNVRAFVAAGLGIAVVPAPRVGSSESVPGAVVYREIPDPGAFRDICLTWSAERRLLPAAELFRRHAIRRAAAGKLPEVQDEGTR
jgi:LysR family transcriptional regulator, transcription activator of glutamate synthase operon